MKITRFSTIRLWRQAVLSAQLAFILACLYCLPLAGERLLKPQDILSLRTLQGVALSPDGKTVAYVATEIIRDQNSKPATRSGLWMVSAAGGESRQCGGGSNEYASPHWSPDGSALTFLSHQPGDEGTQIYSADSGCQNIHILSRHKSSIQSFTWSPDGRQIAFLATEPKTPEQLSKEAEGNDESSLSFSDVDRHLSLVKLWILDPSSGKEREVPIGDVHVSGVTWSPDGNRLLLTISKNNDLEIAIRSRLAVEGLSGGSPETYCPVEGKFTSPTWQPDGKSILFLGASAGGREAVASSLYTCSPNLKPVNLTPNIPFTISSFHLLRSTHEVLTVITEKNSRYLAYLDPETKKVSRLSPAGEVVGNSFSLSADDATLACAIDTPHVPAEVYAGPLNGQFARLTHLNPQLEGVALGDSEDISWKGQDGLEITGILIKPVFYQPGHEYPFIVFPHGGPEGAEVNGFQLDAQLLAADGYAVLLPNFRGSSGRGVAYTLEDNRHFGDGDFHDVMAGVDEVIRRGIADPNRMGIEGWSYGGYLAAWTVTQTNRFRAAVMGAGVSSWFRLTSDTPQPLWTMQVHFEVSPYDDPHAYLRNSPIEYVKQVRTPVLILHGVNDPFVSSSQGREFFRALTHFGVPAELVMYPHEGHGLHEPMHRVNGAERILAWFDRWVKNAAPPHGPS